MAVTATGASLATATGPCGAASLAAATGPGGAAVPLPAPTLAAQPRCDEGF